MEQRKQPVFGGSLREVYSRELLALHQENALGRLWAGDASLWPSGDGGPQLIKDNLEFLRIPENLGQLVRPALRIAMEAEAEGLQQRVVIAFGSVYHFSQAVLNLQPGVPVQRCLGIDSCHPSAIRRAESLTEFRKTLFVLVNKSAYRVEDHSLLLYFHHRLKEEVGSAPEKHFAAVSEPNSFLTSVAQEYRFRFVLELPPGILAPYCSLIHLGVQLPAVAGVEPEVLRVACREMKRENTEAAAGGEPPAAEIAALLSATVKSRRLFLNFAASRKLFPFAAALCRLVGESIGKSGGLVPLAMAAPCGMQSMENSGSFVLLKGTEEDAGVEECAAELRKRGVPFVEMTVASPVDFMRLTFRWQVATVLAAARMGLNPFEDCEVALPRGLAANMLNEYSVQNDTLKRRPRIKEGDIQLFAETRARQEISQLNLTECLASLFEHRTSAAYAGVFVFLEPNEEAEKAFERLREEISQALGLPTVLAWGPRSLDTYGHLLQEGAPQGLLLMITEDVKQDLKIPGADYTFGQLYMALALSQFEAMSARSGLALRLHLDSAAPERLAQLQHVMTQALRRIKS